MKQSGGEQKPKASIRLWLKSVVLFLIYLILGGGTVLSFQNCSQPEVQKFESKSSTLSEDEECSECSSQIPEIKYFSMNHNANQVVTPGTRILVKYSSKNASSVKAVVRATGSCTYQQSAHLSEWQIWNQIDGSQVSAEHLLSISDEQVGCTIEACLTALAETEANLEPRTSSSFRSRCSSYSVVSASDGSVGTGSASSSPQLNQFLMASDKGTTEMWPGQNARVVIKSTNSTNLIAKYKPSGSCEMASLVKGYITWPFIYSSSKLAFDAKGNLNFDDVMATEFNESLSGCTVDFCINALKSTQTEADFNPTASLNSRCQTLSFRQSPKITKFLIDALTLDSGVSRGVNEAESYVVAKPTDRLRIEWATTDATATKMKWKYSGQCGYANRVAKDAEVWMDMVGIWGVGATSANNRNVFAIPAANSTDSMIGCSFTYCLTAVNSAMSSQTAQEADGINSKCFHLNVAP